MVTIKEVRSGSDMRKFARFPVQHYRNDPYYVPSFYSDEKNAMNPKKNFALGDCDIRCWLAYKDGKLAGRVMGIIQKKYNRISGRKCIRFSRFECIDDQEVADALIGAVEQYGREQGMDTIHGPWGFNDQDREGMLYEGFDRRATYATNYNYDYYPKRIEAMGFVPESEWVEYDFRIPETVDERLQRISKYVTEKLGLREVAETAPMRKLIPRYGHKILAMTNEAYAHLDCYVPLDEREMDNVLDQFATVINQRYFSVLVDKNDDVVACGVIIPSLCSVLQKHRGRMTPCAILGLLQAIKHPKELEMVLVAVRKDYRNKGVNSLMMARITKNIIEDQIEHVESNPELVTNLAVQAQWDVFEREIVKRRRTYTKAL